MAQIYIFNFDVMSTAVEICKDSLLICPNLPTHVPLVISHLLVAPLHDESSTHAAAPIQVETKVFSSPIYLCLFHFLFNYRMTSSIWTQVGTSVINLSCYATTHMAIAVKVNYLLLHTHTHIYPLELEHKN